MTTHTILLSNAMGAGAFLKHLTREIGQHVGKCVVELIEKVDTGDDESTLAIRVRDPRDEDEEALVVADAAHLAFLNDDTVREPKTCRKVENGGNHGPNYVLSDLFSRNSSVKRLRPDGVSMDTLLEEYVTYLKDRKLNIVPSLRDFEGEMVYMSADHTQLDYFIRFLISRNANFGRAPLDHDETEAPEIRRGYKLEAIRRYRVGVEELTMILDDVKAPPTEGDDHWDEESRKTILRLWPTSIRKLTEYADKLQAEVDAGNDTATRSLLNDAADTVQCASEGRICWTKEDIAQDHPREPSLKEVALTRLRAAINELGMAKPASPADEAVVSASIKSLMAIANDLQKEVDAEADKT